MAGLFLEELPQGLAAIREAISRRDARNLERAAHALKGSVGNFVAQRAFDAALELEMMGREGNLEGVDEAFANLERELARLEPVLAGIHQEIQA